MVQGRNNKQEACRIFFTILELAVKKVPLEDTPITVP
jgi:hypothetical protein